MDMTIHKGKRVSTSTAYLKPALHRPNLDVNSVSMVEKILFDDHHRAIGVRYKQHGVSVDVYANKEVIVCAGAINTPQLLMLSGVGDADHLGKYFPISEVFVCLVEKTGE